jgi:hypothetical protein
MDFYTTIEDKKMRRNRRAFEELQETLSSKTMEFLRKVKVTEYTRIKSYIKNRHKARFCPLCGSDSDYILFNRVCYLCNPEYEDNPNLTPAHYIPEMFRKDGYIAIYVHSDGVSRGYKWEAY